MTLSVLGTAAAFAAFFASAPALPKAVHTYLNPAASIVFLDAPCHQAGAPKQARQAIINIRKPFPRELLGCWIDVGDVLFLIDDEGDAGEVPKDGGPGLNEKDWI